MKYIILSIGLVLAMMGVCFAGIPAHGSYASGNSVDGNLIANGITTATLESDSGIDTVAWDTASGSIVWSVPGDITIEDLFDQDCKMIGWNKKTEKLVCYEYSKKITSKGEGKMFSFLFGVLGSVFFWAAYLGMTIVVGTMIVKKINPKFYKRVMGKGFNDYRWNDGSDWSAESAILIYLFWPIISILYIVKYALKWLLLKPFILAVRAAGKNLPTISFDKKPESE